MIFNVTGHRITVYPQDCPDVVTPGEVVPLLVLPPVGPAVQLTETAAGPVARDITAALGDADDAIEIVPVVYGPAVNLPPWDGQTPPALRYIVPLAVAIAEHQATGRPDLLVSLDRVRDHHGRDIGCRRLATPTEGAPRA